MEFLLSLLYLADGIISIMLGVMIAVIYSVRLEEVQRHYPLTWVLMGGMIVTHGAILLLGGTPGW